MQPFAYRCPDLAKAETRSITTIETPGLPDDEYGFIEFYCSEPDCDCRRVIFHVMSERQRKVLATINYGWESAAFYRRWMGGASGEKQVGAQLEPFGPQSEYSAALLNLFTTVLISDESYVERIKLHYAAFKAAGASNKLWQAPPKKLPDPNYTPPEKVPSPYLRNRKAKLNAKKARNGD